MAISILQTAPRFAIIFAASGSCTFPGACTPGSLIVAQGSGAAITLTMSAKDSANLGGGNYTQDAFIASTVAAGGVTGLYSAQNSSTAAVQVTLTYSASNAGSISAIEVSGTTALAEVTATNRGTTGTTLSITPLSATDLVVAQIIYRVGTTFTPTLDAGYSQVFANPAQATDAYAEYNTSASGAQTLQFGLNASATTTFAIAAAAYPAADNLLGQQCL